MIQVLDGLITTNEAAKRAGKSVATIHRWMREDRLKPEGKVPGHTGTFLFRPEAIDAAAGSTPAP